MVIKPIIIPRLVLSNKLLWYILLYCCIVYNFHRYIFKYSHGGYPKEGYQQTPLVWQGGKFVLVAVLLALIYVRGKFTLKLPLPVVLFYAFISLIILVNLWSSIFYNVLSTDEFEYSIFAISVLPIAFLTKESLSGLADDIKSILNSCQYIVIYSNLLVIINYFVLDILPFHAYRGVLLRFGGLWDDPNTFGIISVFLLGISIANKQYVLSGAHVINILLTVSLTSYILLVTFAAYYFINTSKNRILRISVFVALFLSVVFIAVLNADLLTQVYEAKRESIEQHATIDLGFKLIPLLQPIQFHETWLLSFSVNYFPLSVPVILLLVFLFIKFFLFDRKSLQRLMYILFFVSSLFLPFLYMFPINFIALLFFVLYAKEVRF
ncbi:hypothetical protein [Spirosoma sp. KUDC1026]|uniref:hypothetical protein n=1 Tax=Spirosoma sp. KUDC1026 TaxID=2745947 RepID=UPI00159B94E0|nr:hypothetical protein [Spirosoma sp. KUDC1026]QKZ11941.1 hypothetical protein HU175_04560 [Spirosoma sp. KUDC1026]